MYMRQQKRVTLARTFFMVVTCRGRRKPPEIKNEQASGSSARLAYTLALGNAAILAQILVEILIISSES